MMDTLSTWTCRAPECNNKADGIGSPVGLLAIGWSIERKGDGDYLFFCPEHHPEGIEISAAVARECLENMYNGFNDRNND
jgi:hypothetical protein